MESLDIELEDGKRLEIEGGDTGPGYVCVDISGEYFVSNFYVTKDEAEEIIAHFQKVFELGIAITAA